MSKNNIDSRIDYEMLGFRIGQRRRELNIKQSELAEVVGVSTKYISNIETGKRHLSLELLAKITISLNTTFDFLINGYIRKNTDKNIYDGLSICSEDDKQLILEIVRYCSSKNRK